MFEFPWVLLLVPFTFWWFAFLGLLTVLAFWAIDYEDSLAGTIWWTVLAGCAFLLFGTGADWIAWAFKHPLHIAGGATIYFAAGTGWALLKWVCFIRAANDLYHRLTDQWSQHQEHYTGRESFIAAHWPYRRRDFGFRPIAADHKARITNWIAYWPISLIWTLLRDWIKAFGEAIYRAIGGLLDRISEKLWVE